MGKLLLSLAIGLVSGVICFFLSVAFLAIVLLIIGGVSHSRPDMTYAYRVALPVAALAAMSGFSVSLVRFIRAAHKSKGQPTG